ncbi:MAG: response regulator [Coriobacteriales bacterium]
MRAIIVDDEPLMVRKFVRLASAIPDLHIVGQPGGPHEALAFCAENEVDIAFLDVEMPGMSGIDLAVRLREIRDDIIIVFVTAYEEYIWESNRIGADYYIVKPYSAAVLEQTMERVRLLAGRQRKSIYIQTFGRFLVKKDGRPVKLTGKAKEILALVVTRRGKEISNEEIYCTIWEDRPLDNRSMSVYYNALRRLKRALAAEGLDGLLVSTARGQTVDTDLFDCDFYAWKDGKLDVRNLYEGEFMSEYSWSEYLISEIVN